MTNEGINYSAILADLEAKKAAIEAALSSLRSALAMGALGVAGEGGASVSFLSQAVISSSDIPDGAFFGKSIVEGAKMYLQMVKKKQSTREIAEALRKGGMESTAKSFFNMVHSVLDRASKGTSGIVKVDKLWGLAEWYRLGARTINPAAHRRPQKKHGKAAAAPMAAKTPGLETRIIQLFQKQPAAELMPKQIAEQLGARIQTISLILGKESMKKKLEKTPSGLYKLILKQLVASN